MNEPLSVRPVPRYRLVAGKHRATRTNDLPTLADALAQLGHEARGDDALGADWACWADWCWRAGVPPLPASPETAQAFAADVAGDMPDADALLDIIVVVGDRHRAAGHRDPFDGRIR
ncbi:hypothetical protein SAMN05660748_1064 [Blastococcus aggregatus]|uniref:Uncharacterized protein n=1 Tax=Blastococcus aggregatus TaxID=38502 RepID=A0A285V1B3_9ACTN|nr:hypothetical protein [Blastococcus aggregatus]SOC47833.1 hypothetical protein SAMN05660748_1064 [Blastococcus aggregatus]